MSTKDTDNQGPVMQIGRFEINQADFSKTPDYEDMPLLTTRNLVLFPGVTIPISLGREVSLKIATDASKKHYPIGIVCQKDADEESPTFSRGIHRIGTIADVYQVIELPDGSHTALVHGRERMRIIGKSDGRRRAGEALRARIKPLKDIAATNTEQFKATVAGLTDIASQLSKTMSNGDNSFAVAINNLDDYNDRINFIATNFPIDADKKIGLLRIDDMSRRAVELIALLMEEQERVAVAQDIMEKAQRRMKDNQRSAYLQMQMETIKEELYGEDMPGEMDDYEDLSKRSREAHMPEAVQKTFDKELSKLRRVNPGSPDYSVQYTYLDTLLDVPWYKQTETTKDIEFTRNVLENDHYGLEKVKQRVLEQIAVLINNPKSKAPILCLVGPPGVGKTSLGKSVARAMGRKYERVSLGGVHDESEIRGHRRTYIGALPGRIIRAMKNVGVINPVLLLDEVDKLGNDYKGDPSSALLEVLDPEQNNTFHDNYLDVDYDLSKVIFIATANNMASIPAPLLDRMEIIDLSGYLLEEKIEIARRHLLPQILVENGLETDDAIASISDDTLTAIIEHYTAESGVRQLQKRLSAIVRKAILARISNDNEFPSTITPDDLQPMLGLPPYTKEKYENSGLPGVVTGLAWTQVGGEILLAEASLSAGKGDRLTITGNLGDVMKESATIALQWVKANATNLGIDPEMFEKNNLHIHFPEGAIPKDGPSAGITIATAITSIFTGRPVKDRIAMTGEITLRGKVLPVGGIKEKILAAKRAGINTIILSKVNRRDIEDIPERYRDGLDFVYVDTVMEVIDAALV